MGCTRRLIAVAAFCAALGASSGASAVEPKVRGGKALLKIAGEAGKYHLIEPGSAVSVNLRGPGSFALKLRAVQPTAGSGAVGTLHVSVDGANVGTFAGSAGQGIRFLGRKDITASPPIDREVRIGEGQRVIVLTAENGPVAVWIDWELEAGALLTATPLVADKPDILAPVALAPELAPEPQRPPPVKPSPEAERQPSVKPAPEAQRQPSLKPAPPREEAIVPITVDASTPTHSAWPYFVLAGALATGFGGAVVWAVAANTDSSYNSTPEGPGRNGKLGTANDELHASMILAGVAIGLAAAGTVGLIFQ